MDSVFHEDQTFEKVEYTGQVIRRTEFQSCIFKKCDFANSDFSNNKFLDCRFESCNLSMMKLKATTLSSAVFKDCKIMGVNFMDCIDFLFTVAFDGCVLDYSSFMGKKMVKTKFIRTSLKDVNFIQAGLSGSVFEETDLMGAIFSQTDLTSANLATAFNYALDPELNTIKKAHFSSQGLPGLLVKYNIKIV